MKLKRSFRTFWKINSNIKQFNMLHFIRNQQKVQWKKLDRKKGLTRNTFCRPTEPDLRNNPSTLKWLFKYSNASTRKLKKKKQSKLNLWITDPHKSKNELYGTLIQIYVNYHIRQKSAREVTILLTFDKTKPKYFSDFSLTSLNSSWLGPDITRLYWKSKRFEKIVLKFLLYYTHLYVFTIKSNMGGIHNIYIIIYIKLNNKQELTLVCCSIGHPSHLLKEHFQEKHQTNMTDSLEKAIKHKYTPYFSNNNVYKFFSCGVIPKIRDWQFWQGFKNVCVPWLLHSGNNPEEI